MKKSQILVATLCASALVLSACTIGRKPSKKKKSSSQDVPTSVVPGPTSSGTTTSGTPAPTPTSGTSTAPVKVLQSIDVTTAPTTTVYTDGQSFDKTGMVVTATYSDGSTANVTDQCQISPTVLTESTTAVTITFGGQSTTQAVTVNPATPTSWTAAQLELLNSYLDGQAEAIPFKYVEGAKLFRDPEYVCLTYGQGTDTSSEDFIKSYAALFSSDWNIAIDQDYLKEYEALMYVGEKTFTVEGDEITLTVKLYGMDDNGDITKDGSGHFGMDLSDGFYYGWEEFDPDYLALLDYFYNGVDEEGYPAKFPEADVVEFEGDVAQIEGVDNTDSTSPYFVAYMYGITDADFYEFLDAFDASSAWTGTHDNLQDIDCYYHTASESVAIGYNYNPSYKIGILFFYQYEKSYTSWSEVSPLVDNFVDTINPETTIQVPAFEAPVYAVEEHADKGYIGVFGLGSDDVTITQENVDKYVQALDPTVWTVEPMQDEEQEPYYDADDNLVTFATEAEAQSYITEQALENAEVAFYEAGNFYYILVTSIFHYYIASAKDYSMNLQIAYNAYTNSEGGYAAIIIFPTAPLTETFPSEQILALFTAGEITVENLPSYSTSEGKFLVDADGKYVGVEVFGSNSEEATAYVTALTSNGWTVDTEASDSENNLTVLMYGSTMARCKVADYSDKAGVHEVVIEFDIKVVDWSDDMKALFTAHLDGVIPPYFDAPLEYNADNDFFYFYVGDSATQELINAYYAFQGDSNWTQEGEYVSFSCESENGTVSAYWSSNGYFIIMLQLNAWSESELADISKALHGVELPFVSGGLDSNLSNPDEGHLEGGSYVSEETITAVEDALVEAGWQKVTEEDSYYYKKDSADGEGYAKFYWVKETSGTYFAADFVAKDVPTPGEPVTVEKTVEEIATANSWVSGTIYSSFQLDENITVTASAGSNNGKYWEASGGKQYRLFQSEAGTMTISAPEGYEIQSITLTFNYQETGILMYGDTQVTSGTAVEVNAQSATFTVSQTDSSKHGKIFITSFVVVYAPVSE